MLAIQGEPLARFDPQKFTWLGSLSSFADDAYMLVVNSTHPAKTVDDLRWTGPTPALAAMGERLGAPRLLERAEAVAT